MKGTYQLGTMFGVPVKVHWSFLLLPAWAVGSSLYNGMSYYATGWLLAYILSLFGCVVLHEFGHILMARKFGVGTQDVILTPIGGMARLNHIPEKPKNEFAVSIAGPLVNVAIIALLSPSLLFAPMSELFAINTSNIIFEGPTFFLRILITANLILVVLNLVPAFPLDGGRILRAGLSYKFGRRRGTRIATIIGKILAIGMIGLGIFLAAPSFVLIGLFVFVMGAIEYKAIANEAIKRETAVSEIINYDFSRFYLSTPIKDVIRVMSLGSTNDFVVLDDTNQVVGLITHHSIDRALHQNALDKECRDFITPLPTYLLLEMTLAKAESILKRYGLSQLPILNSNQIVGTITLESIDHYMKFKRKFMTLPFSMSRK